MLSPDVIRADHDLDSKASRTTEELAKLRWHWTLDETNSARVSLREYAIAVGRNVSTVSKQARGYANWGVAVPQHPDRSLGEAIELASLSETRQAAAVAIAEAGGRPIIATIQRDAETIREVVGLAEEKAIANGTTVEEEIPAAAKAEVRRQRAAREVIASAHRLVADPSGLDVLFGLATLRPRLREIADGLLAAQREHAAFTPDVIEKLQENVETLRHYANVFEQLATGELTSVVTDSEIAAFLGSE